MSSPALVTRLNNDQVKALAQGADFALRAVRGEGDGQPFTINGAAGTGKTTVLRELINTLTSEGVKVGVGTPTGKAANALNKKFLKENDAHGLRATSLHSLLTIPNSAEMQKLLADDKFMVIQGELHGFTDEQNDKIKEGRKRMDWLIAHNRHVRFDPAENASALPFQVLVIDEGSMVPMEFYRTHIAHLTMPLIVVGDYRQLPPVKDVAAFDLSDGRANITLTKNERNGPGSVIPDYAGFLYNEHRFPKREAFAGHDDLVLTHAEHSVTLRKYFDAQRAEDENIMFVCARNDDVSELNYLVRYWMGRHVKHEFDAYTPVEGEMLILDTNMRQKNYYKGDDFKVVKVIQGPSSGLPFQCNLRLEGPDGHTAEYPNINMAKLALPYMKSLSKKWDEGRKHRYLHAVKESEGANPMQFMWSGAVTAHKAQGSEWDHVVVHRGWGRGADRQFNRWYYTAATRGRKKLVVSDNFYREM